MGLKEILQELGAKEPFYENGELNNDGIKAMDKLLHIVDGLEYIGALGKSGYKLENYINDIVRLGY